MQKKLIVLLLSINLFSCITASSLEEVKAHYVDFLTSDSILTRQAHESGLLEKIQNASSSDSVLVYWEQFRGYKDSLQKIKQ